jgi:hypothetical protein
MKQQRAKAKPLARRAAPAATVQRAVALGAQLQSFGNQRMGVAPGNSTGLRVQPRLRAGAFGPAASGSQPAPSPEDGKPSPAPNANKVAPQAGGDTSSSKVLRVAWTFDDGPTIQAARKDEKKKNITADMQKSMTPVKRVTWFIQYNKIKSGNEKENLDRLRQIQAEGGEIGIHSFHEKREHVSWFPSKTLDSYASIEDAMADLKTFAEFLKKEGMAVKFVREPYGLVTELAHYLGKLGAPGDQAKRLRIARDVIRDQVSVAESKDPRIMQVKRDLQTLKHSLYGLGLHLWGGSTGSSPEVDTQSWQIESSGVGGRTDSLTRKAFEDKVRRIAETGNADSLVILAHDLTSADVDEVANDKAMMEEKARKLKVRIEYYTMSELHSIVRPALPQLLPQEVAPKVSPPRSPEISSPAVPWPEVLPPVLPQLEVGRIDDPAEREAEATAEHIMRMPAGKDCCPACAAGEKCAAHPLIERGAKKPAIRRRPMGGAGGLPVAPELEPAVRRATAGGEALPQAVRASFEPRFGEELSHVRVHRDADASASASALDARAYTRGDHIAFASGRWAPGTAAGDRLIAHELTHVLQQDAGAAAPVRRAPDDKDAVKRVTSSRVEAKQKHLISIENQLQRRVRKRQKGLTELRAHLGTAPKGERKERADRLDADLAKDLDAVVAHPDSKGVSRALRADIIEWVRKRDDAQVELTELTQAWGEFDGIFAGKEVAENLGTGLTPAQLKALIGQESADLTKSDIDPDKDKIGVAQMGAAEAKEAGGSPDDRKVPEKAIPLAAKLVGLRAARLDKALKAKVTGVERARFIMASYNGGMNLVLTAQRIAIEMGRSGTTWESLIAGDKKSPLYRALEATYKAKQVEGKFKEVKDYIRNIEARLPDQKQ